MSKTNLKAMVGTSIESVELLDTGYTQLTLSDGQTVIVKIAALVAAEEVEEEVEEEAPKAKGKGKGKKAPAPEPEPEEEDDDDEFEEELDIEEVRQALIDAGYTKKELKGMSDEELVEAYEELEEDGDDEDDEDDDEDWDD